MANPFRNTIVMDPWDPNEIDVPEINKDAFNLCCEALDAVRIGRKSTSVLLHGEPGTGKTHLLSRLRAHVKGQTRLQVFVSVRLQSSPHRFWRHIRKSFVENLIRPVKNGRSQLERIFLGRLYLLCRKKKVAVKEFLSLIEKLSAEADLSRNLCKALEHLIIKRHRMDVVAWLKGDSIPESSLMKMDMAQEIEDVEDPEDQAREFIHELCRLAGPEIPMVLCFDQVEALQRYQQGDAESLFVFGQAIGSLHDKTSNVLLVLCIQSLFLNLLKDAVMEPDYDRLSVRRGTLNPLTIRQSLKLVSARVEACRDLSGKKKKELNTAYENDLRQFVRPSGETARKVLSRCADLFDAWEKGAPFTPKEQETGRSDGEFLSGEKASREEKAIRDFTPEKTDEIIQSAVPVLVNVMDEKWKEQDRNRPRDVDIILEGSGLKVGLSLCNQNNMKSLAGRFKRLRGQIKEIDLDSMILIRHSELPISSRAKKTRTYLEELKQQKVRLLTPDTEVIAALDALRSLLADARAGDLANSGKTLGDGAVRRWLKEHLRGPAQDFLDDVISFHGPPDDGSSEILQDLLEFLEQERVAKLNDAAEKLQADLNIFKDCIRRHPRQIGYLEGPPPVIFQFIPESADSD